jgi:phosphate transport system substrate-binding protein
VSPSEETIKSKQYPLVRPFLFLTKGEPTGDTKAFIDWVLGPEGQEIALKNGIHPPNK